MSDTILIVMYHYVRELERSRFPRINGLTTDEFRQQIQYIRQHYTVVSADYLLDAVTNGEELPPRAILLTFDDGYIDHFTQVFPILDQEQLPAAFFVPVQCITEDKVLDVNKIHFILAATRDIQKVIRSIFQILDSYRDHYELLPNDLYWEKLARPGRLDPAEIVFVKRLLQRELPSSLRTMMVDTLFATYVTDDEVSFARELYMTTDQLRCLRDHGMYIGGHGYSHVWLDAIDRSAQQQEIDQSLEFLKGIGHTGKEWIMCYPYGAYDESLLTLLRERNCRIGLSTRMGVANCASDNLLALPRIDTNYLPPRSNTPLSFA